MIKKINTLLISGVFASVAILANNISNNEYYKPLPIEVSEKIALKEQEILNLMQSNYGFKFKVPLVITNDMEDNVYGVTICDNDGSIKIYLNKQIVMKDLDYVIDTVMSHEYAHALMFKQKLLANNIDGYALKINDAKLPEKHDGHNSVWEKTCQKLGAEKCEKFVTYEDATRNERLF